VAVHFAAIRPEKVMWLCHLPYLKLRKTRDAEDARWLCEIDRTTASIPMWLCPLPHAADLDVPHIHRRAWSGSFPIGGSDTLELG
jgi:hypothetical protein